MNRQPLTLQPPRWDAKLSPLWIRLLKGRRRRFREENQRLLEIEAEGLEHLRAARAQGAGIMITPNHCSHADPHALYGAADEIGLPLYILTAWQTYAKATPLMRWIFQRHGAFSIGREGTDLWAVRRAVQIMTSEPWPLLVFPEGEIYHLNDRLTPFREGPAVMALTAARHAKRPILIVPCAIKYRYIQDPTPELERVMEALEERLNWRPRRDLTLAERIYRYAEAGLGLKELEHMGQVQQGALPERVGRLREHIMDIIERQHRLTAEGMTMPERIKQARCACLEAIGEAMADEGKIATMRRQLEDIFLAVQLYSYPGDYVAENPTLERLAETIDKFEEDLLGARTATIRGARRARVSFGEPIDVREYLKGNAQARQAAPALTVRVESAVQELLHELIHGARAAELAA